MENGEGKTLIKHSASIQITNRISFLARRVSNVLLANARKMPPDTVAYEMQLSDLRREIEFNSKNIDHLKSAIRSLAGTVVEYNIFDKDKGNEWGVFALLSQVKIRDNHVRYWYPPDIRELLMSPNVYARLDLEVQNRFTSKHSIALWEYLTDALGSKRIEADIYLSISDFRRLMSLGSEEYPEFCDLNKRVIKPAVSEINTHSKIAVEVVVRRKGRTPEALLFSICRIKPIVFPNLTDAGRQQSENGVPVQSGGVLSQLSKAGDDPDGIVRRERILQRLIGTFGLTSASAEKALSEYDWDYICDNLDIVERTLKKGGVRNLAAYTLGALKTDYRPRGQTLGKLASRGGDHYTRRTRQDCETQRIEMARKWYAGLEPGRQDTIRELFIAGLNGTRLDAVRDLYYKHGVNHPEVTRALMLHIAANLERKHASAPSFEGESPPQ